MLWTEVWPTRPPKGVRSAPGLWLSRPRIRSSRGRVRANVNTIDGCVRVRLCSLWLGTSRFSLSKCDPCARVSRVSRGRVYSSSPQVWLCSVWV